MVSEELLAGTEIHRGVCGWRGMGGGGGGGGGGVKRETIPNATLHTVTTRMAPALRWATARGVLTFR